MFKRTTSQLENSTGRGFEIAIGLIVAFIALVFWWLLFLVVSNASPSTPSIIGGASLALAGLWFGHLSYRLVFNKPRDGGGLFAPWALKVWLLLLTVGAVAVFVIAIVSAEYSLAFSSFAMALILGTSWLQKNRRIQ